MSLNELTPKSLIAERSLLGAVLLDGKCFESVSDMLVPEDFGLPEHRTIFAVMASIFDRGQPIDPITVWNGAGSPRGGGDESAATLPYLNAMAQNTPGSTNVRRYAELVRRYGLLRRIWEISNSAAVSAGAPNTEPHELAEKTEADLIRAMDRSEGDPVPLAEAVNEAITYANERTESGQSMSGVSCGLDGLDRFTNGLEPGQLVVVAARPSIGKTALACCITSAMSAAGRKGLFFTLEMSRREIGQRILALRSGVSTHAMRSGTKEDRHWLRMVDAQERIQPEQVFIDDTPAVTVGYIRAKARRLARRIGLDFVIVDYIGLMRGHGENRTQEIGSISRGLKALAKELAVPVIALAQLNRDVERRGDARPLLSDLRDSGEIEQDADIVVMLHRQSKHGGGPEWDGLAELLVRKNRNGPTGDALLFFNDEIGSFGDTDRQNPRGLSQPPVNRAITYDR